MNKEYEILYIIKPSLSDAKYEETILKMKDIIEKNEGEIVTLKSWGMRNLAITFKKYQQGYYVESRFKGSSATLDAIKKHIQVTEDIIRHLIVHLESIEPKIKEAKVGKS
ncbi:MAG: 30S ribosomal protein S6 [Candidatus Margulisiibacteriota bacterium]|jgi:small subunit ribosomal protein S6